MKETQIIADSTTGTTQQTLDSFTHKRCNKGLSEKMTALITEINVVDMQPLSMVEDVCSIP